MKKYKYLLPVAIIATGFWACGDENTTATECTTEQCLIDKYGEFNADSANLANQQTPVETIDFEINEGPNVIDVPSDSSGATTQEPVVTPQDSSLVAVPISTTIAFLKPASRMATTLHKRSAPAIDGFW